MIAPEFKRPWAVSSARIEELIVIMAGGNPSDDDCVDAGCALRQSAALVEELRNDFINIVVGGCTCGTKPPDPELHELSCHYRMAETGLARIAALAKVKP